MIAAMLPTPAPKKNDVLDMASLLGLVTEIGFMIALPAVFFGFGGAYLDKTLNTSPLCIIAGLVVAILSSFLAVWHRIKPLLK